VTDMIAGVAAKQSQKGRYRYSWYLVYFCFYLYRCVYSVVGEVVIMRMTPISDTTSYQYGHIPNAIANIQLAIANPKIMMQDASTAMTKLVGGILGAMSGHDPIFSNLGFQTIGFIGLVILLHEIPVRQRMLFLGVLMLPSFTLWSSIASKESIVVSCLGILLAAALRLFLGKKHSIVLFSAALIVLYIFKPHFMIPFIYLYGLLLVAPYVKQRATLAFIALGVTLVFLYLFRQEIDEYSRYVDYALGSMGGRSARPIFLTEQWDTFTKAPIGIYLAFTGPTYDEASNGILHMFSFVESLFMLFLLGFMMVRRLPEIPVFSLILVLGTTFWAAFTNYPLGASNPGTAIRYRTDWILFLHFGFFLLLSRDRYEDWIRIRLSSVKSKVQNLKQA
jgi:hypothetical protein